MFGTSSCVLCREAVLILESPPSDKSLSVYRVILILSSIFINLNVVRLQYAGFFADYYVVYEDSMSCSAIC